MLSLRCLDNQLSLQMRIGAYWRMPMQLCPLDDLRQLLRDVRGLLASFKEGSAPTGKHVEAVLRERIAADLAAQSLRTTER